jgi:hypothetical protein
MTRYAYYDDTRYITELDETELPGSAQRQDTWAWISDLRNADPADQRKAGYYRITPTPRPADTPGTTYDRNHDLTDWPTIREYWSPRPKTDLERATDNARQLERDTATNIDAIRHATDNIRTIIDTPNAQINAGPAPYIKAMARDCLDIARQTIRLARIITDTTADTGTDYGTGTATTTHNWMIVL